MHSSRNAYMLAYTRRNHRKRFVLDTRPPTWAAEAVQVANLEFEEEMEDYKRRLYSIFISYFLIYYFLNIVWRYFCRMEVLRNEFYRKREERRNIYMTWNVKNDDVS